MGKVFSFEGPDRVGKTTQIRAIKQILENMGYDVQTTREPGGTPIGDQVRKILKDYGEKMHPTTNVLLFNASRSELTYDLIVPWRKEHPDGILLVDRSWMSTLAFQKNDGASIDYIKGVIAPFIKEWPDFFIFTDLHPQESMIRAERDKRMNVEGWYRDFESEETYSKIRMNYLNLVKQYRDRTLVLDGFDHPVNRIDNTLAFILGEKPFEFTEEKRESILKIWEHSGLNFSEMTEIDRNIRKEMGFLDKEVLQQKMHEDWIKLGIEGNPNRLERV